MTKENEITFISLLLKIARHRKLIVLNFLIVSIVALIISLIMPKWYKAEAIIMPPVKEGGLGFGMGMAGQLAGMMMGGGGDFDLPMFATPSDIFEMILKSKSVSDSLISQYDLIKLYKQLTIEETRLALASHTFIEVGKEGAIFLGFEAEDDPELAAKVVRSYIQELDKTNRRVKVVYAHNTRKFIAERLEKAVHELTAAEDSLLAFQERFNIISIEDQVTAAVNNAAQILATKQMFEFQLDAVKQSLSPTHPQVRELEAKISSLNRQIRQMKYGDENRTANASRKDTELFPAFAKTPELGLELARRIRNLKIQEIIFELLTQQHEQEKISEARNTPTVVVLDKAITPTKKSRPKRALIVALSALLSIFFSIFLIFVKEHVKRLKENDSAEFERLQELKTEIKYLFRKRRDNN